MICYTTIGRGLFGTGLIIAFIVVSCYHLPSTAHGVHIVVLQQSIEIIFCHVPGVDRMMIVIWSQPVQLAI